MLDVGAEDEGCRKCAVPCGIEDRTEVPVGDHRRAQVIRAPGGSKSSSRRSGYIGEW
jgi:hypothetical protein